MIDSYGLWRGVVTVYTLVAVQHPRWTVWFNSVNSDTNFWAWMHWLDGQQQLAVNAILPQQHAQLIPTDSAVHFLKVVKTHVDIFCIPRFLENLLES